MRLLLDVQGAQTDQSARRGVGRYTLGLVEAMLREAGSHEIWLAASTHWPDSLVSLRRRFGDLLPPERIRAWQVPAGIAAYPPGRGWRSRAAQALREQFLATLKPDILHVASLQEGLAEDAASSIGQLPNGPPTGCVLYDLTPAAMAEELLHSPTSRRWYQAKLRDYGRARLLLAISENTRRDAIDLLGRAPADVVTISAGVDPVFQACSLPPGDTTAWAAARFGITKPFVCCYGGANPYKNVDRLLEAFARLPAALRAQHQLVLAGPIMPLDLARLQATARRVGLMPDEWLRLGFLPDPDLVQLLQACRLFVYPSLREGFGLPVAEAMACGAPVLCGNLSSLPEVVGRADAMFDPSDAGAIEGLMRRALEDRAFRASLSAHGLDRARHFTWQACARAALAAYEAVAEEQQAAAGEHRAVPVALPYRPRLAWVTDWPLQEGRDALLRSLAVHYDIDLVLDRPASTITVHHGLPVVPADEAFGDLPRYDRVVLERADPAPWLARHPALLVGTGTAAAPQALGTFDPAECGGAEGAARLQQAIEASHAGAASPLALARSLARILPATGAEDFEAEVADALSANTAPAGPPRLLVDVSVTALRHHGSGIARVVDRIVHHLRAARPAGLQVELLRGIETDGQMRHARRFEAFLDGCPADQADGLEEPVVEPRPGDHFLGLDLNHQVTAHAAFFRRLNAVGGQASAVVYDLLPLQRPDWFPPGVSEGHAGWFAQCARMDRMISISASVAADVQAELSSFAIDGTLPTLRWFHLAGDLPAAAVGPPVAELAGRPSIMLVSVLWARKGQEQTLDAFERLWAAGVAVNLVFVGRVGWGVDRLVERLRRHPERDRRLFWYDGPDDALLARLYATVDGVLVASEGEGFGLPLVEAAQHGRPVLARDLPVFREIMGEQVRYFTGLAAEDLAAALRGWLVELADGTAPKADATAFPDWAASCRQLVAALDLRPTS